MELRKLKELLDKHQSGQASEAERQLIETWYASFSKNEEQDPLVNSIQKAHIRSQIWSGIQIGPPLPKRTFKQRYLLPMISAAAVLLVLGITINQDILTFRSSIQQATLPKFQSS
ncbi:hypothetical protein M8994_23235, partial [Brucella sp. 21LCYQ03]|nr:hypothetical protein [Brucella sp. 21LCYQ03]